MTEHYPTGRTKTTANIMYEGMCLHAFYKLHLDSTVSLPPKKVLCCLVTSAHGSFSLQNAVLSTNFGSTGSWADERRAVLQESNGHAGRSGQPWDPLIFRKAFCFVFGLKNEGPAGRRKTKSQMISSMSKLCYEQISIPNSNLE